MENKDKTLLIVIIAIIAVVSCGLLFCCAGSLFLLTKSDTNAIVEKILESGNLQEALPLSTKEVAPDESVDDQSAESTAAPTELRPGLNEIQSKIIDTSEKIRGLNSNEPIEIVYQTTEELRNYLMENLFKDSSDDDLDEQNRLYHILGFAPKDFDLKQFYIDLYAEQITGFYDSETDKMYLIGDKTDEAENNLTLAHEYTHFLQSHNNLFADVVNINDDYCETHNEECLALNALEEGDATLVETLLAQDETLNLYAESGEENTEDESNFFDNAPKYMQDSLLFPYSYGFDFVWYLYMHGGFDAVNDAYKNLPTSVEQIIHPEKYLKDLPIDVSLEPYRSILAKSCDELNEYVLNEDDIKELLGAAYNPDWRLKDRQAEAAAEGWGGGGYIFTRCNGQDLFFTKIVWDTLEDAKEAESAFSIYNDKRFGSKVAENTWQTKENGTVYLLRQEDVLYWMILPETFNANQIIDRLNTGTSL